MFTINTPIKFKNAVLEYAQQFGGASELVSLCLDDLALRLKKIKKRLDIIEELNDYVKLEILLMRQYEEDAKSLSNDVKLVFRFKDDIVKESLQVIKDKTGWTTSKAIRIALLWYLYANFDDFVATEKFIPLLKCEFCGFITHDQRSLAVHIKTIHETVCPYCGKHYSNVEDHKCRQMEAFASPERDIRAKIEVSQPKSTKIDKIKHEPSIEELDEELDEQKLLESLGIFNFGNISTPPDQKEDISALLPNKKVLEESTEELESIQKELTEIGGAILDLPSKEEISDSKEKDGDKSKKKKKPKQLEELESEISEMLKSLEDDGYI